jgi:hypothetical protein
MIEQRNYLIYLRDRLAYRLAGSNSAQFEQRLKQFDKYNQELAKLSKSIKAAKNEK